MKEITFLKVWQSGIAGFAVAFLINVIFGWFNVNIGNWNLLVLPASIVGCYWAFNKYDLWEIWKFKS